jgi:hypothetical protein
MHNNTTATSKIDNIFLKCNVIDLSATNNVFNYNTLTYNKYNDILIHKNMFDILYNHDIRYDENNY